MANQEAQPLAVPTKPKVFYGYIVVAAGFIASLFLIGTLTSFSIFFKPLSSEFGWTRASTSAAGSIAALVQGFVAIAAGRITDKYGPRLVLIFSALLVSLGVFLMSRIGALWQLYLIWGVVVGAGMCSTDIPIIATIARWFVKKRGMMTGITKVGAGIGTLSIPLLSSLIIYSYGWRNAYVVLSILALAWVIFPALLIKRDPSQTGQLPDGAVKDETQVLTSNVTTRQFSLKEATRTKQLWIFSSMWFSFLFCVQVVMVHIANHITDLGISVTLAASVVSIIGGFSVLGRLGLASLSDIIGIKTTYAITFSLLIAAFLWLQFASTPWMFYLFAALYGTAHGAGFTLIAPMTAELFGLKSLGSVLSIIFLIGMFGGIISPVLAGQIFDTRSSYQLAFWICFALGAIALALNFLLRPTRMKGGK